MKKLLSLVLAGFATMASYGQCAFNNTFYIDATPPCPGTMTAGCVNPGEYVSVNVVAGNTYEFTTCGGTLFTDTELTLYDAFGFTVLDYNDDDCGTQSTITWVATFTGTVNLLLDEFPCSSSSSCVDIDVTCSLPVQSGNGCNTDITICTPGTAGPFAFNTPGAPVSSCLDFIGPDYAYIVLYITSSGPLQLLIDGDAATGFWMLQFLMYQPETHAMRSTMLVMKSAVTMQTLQMVVINLVLFFRAPLLFLHQT
ncbi:MAG: hypothetical protein IPO32_06525 [Crocinitomicaceae bacterium]|nr:hypothetical protein [Crocinitomicaceae bacterium]